MYTVEYRLKSRLDCKVLLYQPGLLPQSSSFYFVLFTVNSCHSGDWAYFTTPLLAPNLPPIPKSLSSYTQEARGYSNLSPTFQACSFLTFTFCLLPPSPSTQVHGTLHCFSRNLTALLTQCPCLLFFIAWTVYTPHSPYLAICPILFLGMCLLPLKAPVFANIPT